MLLLLLLLLLVGRSYSMRLQSFGAASDFLRDIERDFSRNEVEHHLLLGVAHDLAGQRSTARPAVLASLRDETGLALAALMAAGKPLVLATNRSEADVAMDELVAWLRERDIAPRSVIAESAHAKTFVKRWQEASGVSAELRMRQRLYVLRAVNPRRMPAGALRQAVPGDIDLLERWVSAFTVEAMGEGNDPELGERVQRRIALGEIYLWHDDRGEPRSMVASARPTRRGIAVNSVYTPPEWRGRGYATACVATLSDLLLSEGRDFCVLFTDLANPTSNAIYTRIGYRPVSDSVMMTFSADATATR
jgi:predicted GNAT family acetyltransferase